MCFFRVLMAGTLLVFGLGASALGQAPAGTSDATAGKVLDIQEKVLDTQERVLDIQQRVLDIIGLSADTQRATSVISGQVISLGAAIQDLKGAGTGWWSRKRRDHSLPALGAAAARSQNLPSGRCAVRFRSRRLAATSRPGA